MLGNDVVDLEDVDARPETFRSRFDLRVFADDERRAIADDPDPQARRWAHWGAKESAYKLARQIDPRFVFSPARLVPRFGPRLPLNREAQDPGPPHCALGASALPGSVACRRGRLDLAIDPRAGALALALWSFEAPGFVHVVAQPAGGDWARVVMAIEALEALEALGERGEEPGLAVRRLAVREIARALGVDPSRLGIARGADAGDARVPVVALDGRALGGSLSLSHHGRFVAFAFREASAADDRRPRSDAGGRAPAAASLDAGARAGRRGRSEQSLSSPSAPRGRSASIVQSGSWGTRPGGWPQHG